ncbi:MAG: hypothetical protein QW327_02335 [Candidatus Odinarchaeota archaeon]
MSIDLELKQISSMLGIGDEEEFRVDELQNHIDRVWQIINNKQRDINDIILNHLCNLVTKLAIIVDAYRAKMVRFESLKVYVEKEGLAARLLELSKNIS